MLASLALRSLLWRGKRMRVHVCKPVDKLIPRAVREGGGTVVIKEKACFFRAPMLPSKIHGKFDAEFCRSTELQLDRSGIKWDEINLEPAERETVALHEETGEWGPSLGVGGDQGKAGEETKGTTLEVKAGGKKKKAETYAREERRKEAEERKRKKDEWKALRASGHVPRMRALQRKRRAAALLAGAVVVLGFGAVLGLRLTRSRRR
jgi:hypothetical protein